jgi:molybdopterin-guanine dinucleotide biosynthesis protein A
MIAVVAERLRAVVQEVVIAADDTHRYLPFADRCVPDQFPGVGTLGGIHAGLSAASHELALMVGCDMPFIDPDVSRWFVQAAQLRPEPDVVILRRGEWVEPLHAVYRQSCRPAIEAAIRAGRRRVISFFDQVRVRYVAPAEIAHLDGELKSFRNVNTPEEWRALLKEGH